MDIARHRYYLTKCQTHYYFKFLDFECTEFYSNILYVYIFFYIYFWKRLFDQIILTHVCPFSSGEFDQDGIYILRRQFSNLSTRSIIVTRRIYREIMIKNYIFLLPCNSENNRNKNIYIYFHNVCLLLVSYQYINSIKLLILIFQKTFTDFFILLADNVIKLSYYKEVIFRFSTQFFFFFLLGLHLFLDY